MIKLMIVPFLTVGLLFGQGCRGTSAVRNESVASKRPAADQSGADSVTVAGKKAKKDKKDSSRDNDGNDGGSFLGGALLIYLWPEIFLFPFY